MRRQSAIALVLFCAVQPTVFAQDLSGRYVHEAAPTVTLVLEQRNDGVITGSVTGLGRVLRLNVRRTGNDLEGTIGADEVIDVRGRVDGESVTLVLDDGAETHVFRRTATSGAGAVADAGAGAGAGAAAGAGAGAAAVQQGTRRVTVNGQRLTDAELAALEQIYRVRVVDADYWYDALSGAWGVKGGQTRGFIYSGLPLGGPLAADASGGGTGVFVNGRELHPLDVEGLARCVQVNRGRYWVGPDGTGGYEGGPPFFNLIALCSPPSSTGGRAGGWVCDGGSCGTTRTVTGPYAVGSEGDGRAGVFTDQGLILTPN